MKKNKIVHKHFTSLFLLILAGTRAILLLKKFPPQSRNLQFFLRIMIYDKRQCRHRKVIKIDLYENLSVFTGLGAQLRQV